LRAVKRIEAKKIVVAYSGGLDTSVIIAGCKRALPRRDRRLVRRHRPGRGARPPRREGQADGREASYVRKTCASAFVRDFVFPALRANALYEGAYLLGTSLARPASSAAA
jgi:argininosuccinate synthase